MLRKDSEKYQIITIFAENINVNLTHMKKILSLCIATTVMLAGYSKVPTSTIGNYPGNPAENFMPKLVKAGSEYRNLAFMRAGRQSSSIDVNQAVQLVTDGLMADEADFRSTWKSATGKDEWIELDLGAICKIDKVVFRWLKAPVSGKLCASQDGKNWKDITSIRNSNSQLSTLNFQLTKARYVKALLDASADGQPFELEEWEVWGRGGVKAQPAAAPARKGAVQELAGGNWKLVRASALKDTVQLGERLSSANFDDASWMVATVPGTVFTSYVATGAVLDPCYADNQLFASDSYFKSDFWYRNTFKAHPNSERQFLHFDGINYKARIYLNGKYVGGIESAFDAARFDVTGLLKEGTNYLAIKIVRNPNYGEAKVQDAFWPNLNGGILGGDNPTMHATIGWDWIPSVRGRNIGIYDKVYLRYTGNVTVDEPFVRTDVPLPDTTRATIIASAKLCNHSQKPVTGVLKMYFGELTLEESAQLKAGETRLISFSPATLQNPRLWWPNGYGKQELYPVKFEFTEGAQLSDSVNFLSGVRQFDYVMEKYTPQSKSHFTGRNNNQRLSLYVNGRRFVGFGGNWGYPELLLNYRSREYDIAVGYHAAQNFTMIRNWVGMTDNKAFYEACDRYGILIWQDFWLANPADGPDPYNVEQFKNVAQRYVRRIRNHPSVALYVARNEGYPPEEIDQFLDKMVPEEHPGLYYIPHSGADGVNGGGPYSALPVKEYFNLHGQDKILSERGMPCVMNFENMVRAFGAENVNPVNTDEHPNLIYGLHDYCLGVSDKWSAQVTRSFNQMLAKAFGEPADAKEFGYLAQWINYDGYRAIFEARSVYRRGLLLWMSHPTWPSMVWQTYDYFFEPTGAFFGCKKACEPVHIMVNPIQDSVTVVNYHAGDLKDVTATVRILNMYGKELKKQSKTFSINEDQTLGCFPLQVPQDITDVYFVKLSLTKTDGTLLSENFYWRGREEGNLRALRTLGETQLSIKKVKSERVKSEKYAIKNTGQVPALMIRLKAVDSATGDLVLPVWYSDNYFFLMPGESKEVEIATTGQQGRLIIKAEALNVSN